MGYRSKAELADLIERGLKVEGVVEDHIYHLHKGANETVRACAVGLAYIGLVGNAQEALAIFTAGGEVGCFALGPLLNADLRDLWEISADHFQGTSAETIIKKLRKGEYPEWNQNSIE